MKTPASTFSCIHRWWPYGYTVSFTVKSNITKIQLSQITEGICSLLLPSLFEEKQLLIDIKGGGRVSQNDLSNPRPGRLDETLFSYCAAIDALTPKSPPGSLKASLKTSYSALRRGGHIEYTPSATITIDDEQISCAPDTLFSLGQVVPLLPEEIICSLDIFSPARVPLLGLSPSVTHRCSIIGRDDTILLGLSAEGLTALEVKSLLTVPVFDKVANILSTALSLDVVREYENQAKKF